MTSNISSNINFSQFSTRLLNLLFNYMQKIVMIEITRRCNLNQMFNHRIKIAIRLIKYNLKII